MLTTRRSFYILYRICSFTGDSDVFSFNIPDNCLSEFISAIRGGHSLGYRTPLTLIQKLQDIIQCPHLYFVFGRTQLLNTLSKGHLPVYDLSEFSTNELPNGFGVCCCFNEQESHAFSIKVSYHYGKAEWLIYDSYAYALDCVPQKLHQIILKYKGSDPRPTDSSPVELAPKVMDFFAMAQMVFSFKSNKDDFFDLFMGDSKRSVFHSRPPSVLNFDPRTNWIDTFKTLFCEHQKRCHGANLTPDQYECSSVTQLLMAGFRLGLNERRPIILPRGYYTKYLHALTLADGINPELKEDIEKINCGDFKRLRWVHFYTDYGELPDLLKTHKNALLVVCAPSNPPDKPPLTEGGLKMIVPKLNERHFVIEDRAYVDISDESCRHVTFQGLDKAQIISVMTPNKAIGTNGFRAGVCYCNNKNVQQKIRAYLLQNGTCHDDSPAHHVIYYLLSTVYGAPDALSDYLEGYKAALDEKKALINEYLITLGLPPLIPDTGTFYAFLNLNGHPPSHWENCLGRGVAYVPGEVYGKPGYGRINLNNLPLDQIEAVLNTLYYFQPNVHDARDA